MLKHFRFDEVIIVSISVLTLLILILAFPAPLVYRPNLGETVNYWWLMFFRQPMLERSGLIWLFAILVLIAVMGTILGIAKNKRLIVGMIVLGSVCSSSLCFFSLFAGKTTLRHVDSIHFSNLTYHLTEAVSIEGDWDTPLSSFIVYECDESGITCKVLQSNLYEWIATTRKADFVINADNHSLSVEIDGKQFLVAQ